MKPQSSEAWWLCSNPLIYTCSPPNISGQNQGVWTLSQFKGHIGSKFKCFCFAVFPRKVFLIALRWELQLWPITPVVSDSFPSSTGPILFQSWVHPLHLHTWGRHRQCGPNVKVDNGTTWSAYNLHQTVKVLLEGVPRLPEETFSCSLDIFGVWIKPSPPRPKNESIGFPLFKTPTIENDGSIITSLYPC